ncbi:hypothetical protein SAMN05660324_1987 [Klenkia brasiliensis]|uniref:Flp pilus-assembly TadE/G-like n=1 Tax=Klenkia brasiliensis TaxID=333142 RepID=A0A1G7SE47_9ACTN|nr:hypothetical protein SAMN05660324_1987 [Klenkia brasiliensis]
MTRPSREQGSVSVLFCSVVLVAGIVVTALVDAGANIQAANRADNASAEAARAAAIAVGPVPTGGSRDVQLAVAAADAYLRQAGASGSVDVQGPGLVQVTVTVTDSTPLLGLPVRQTRTHSAQLKVGLVDGEPVR